MASQVTVRLTHEDLAALDGLVEAGEFRSRSEVVRAALADLFRERREREIQDAYRRGYGKYPQEEWIGKAGLAAFAAWDAAEGGEPL